MLGAELPCVLRIGQQVNYGTYSRLREVIRNQYPSAGLSWAADGSILLWEGDVTIGTLSLLEADLGQRSSADSRSVVVAAGTTWPVTPTIPTAPSAEGVLSLAANVASPLSAAHTTAIIGIQIQAAATNTAKIYFGRSSVSLSAYRFYLDKPGDSAFSFTSDASQIFAITNTAGQKVCWSVV
jgi:hypothetical protein